MSDPGRTWDDAWYLAARFLLWPPCAAMFGLRTSGPGRRATGRAALYVSNHQSYLDPVLVGIPAAHVLHFMARRTLFVGPFGWLIRRLHAFPVERGRSDVRAVRDAIDLLRDGKSLLIFPEGTRTRTGRMGRLRSGAGMIARRAGVPVVPVRIDGAFRAWPPHQWLPLPGAIRVRYGAPLTIGADEPEEDAMRRIEAAIRDLERANDQDAEDSRRKR